MSPAKAALESRRTWARLAACLEVTDWWQGVHRVRRLSMSHWPPPSHTGRIWSTCQNCADIDKQRKQHVTVMRHTSSADQRPFRRVTAPLKETSFLKACSVQESWHFSRQRLKKRKKKKTRGFYFKMFCWFYSQFRNLHASVKISRIYCRKRHVSQLAKWLSLFGLVPRAIQVPNVFC